MLERTAISGEASLAVTPDSARYRHLSYQPHVDGLRAVAVISVIVFHAFPDALPGGFVGVDIFFVISGYLICGIIFRSLEAGGFSFAEFYARRIRRIFPALILVLAAVLGFGWIALTAVEYKAASLNVTSGAGFAANLLLWKEAGYFAPDARLNPLLHLWSLGVEEQFYLAWPLILYAAWRWRLALVVTVAALIASLSLYILQSETNHIAAFYSPLARLWELQAGALVVYHVGQLSARTRNVAAWCGAALIVVAFALVTKHRFPGALGLLPVAGAALLVAAGKDAFLNRVVLSRRALVWVGLISYPLYLWHWPLLSFAWITNGGVPSVASRVVLIVVAFALSAATWRFFERPIRAGALRRQATGALAGALAIAALAGLIVWREQGLPWRPTAIAYAEVDAATKDWTFPGDDYEKGRLTPATLAGTEDRYVAFIGDSHMEQYWPRAEYLYRVGHPKFGTLFATIDGCPPFLDSHRRAAGGEIDCDQAMAAALVFAQSRQAVKVVFGASWAYYFNNSSRSLVPRMPEMMAGFGHTIADLVARGKQVIVVLQNANSYELDPRPLSGSRWRILLAGGNADEDRAVARRDMVHEFAAFTPPLRKAGAQNGATVIDPMDYFCTASICPATIAGRPLYMDGTHVRASVARERAIFIDDIVLH